MCQVAPASGDGTQSALRLQSATAATQTVLAWQWPPSRTEGYSRIIRQVGDKTNYDDEDRSQHTLYILCLLCVLAATVIVHIHEPATPPSDVISASKPYSLNSDLLACHQRIACKDHKSAVQMEVSEQANAEAAGQTAVAEKHSVA